MTHTGEKPFKCEFCDISFARSRKLNEHKKKCFLEASGAFDDEMIKQEIKEEALETENFVDPSHFVKSELNEDFAEIKEEIQDTVESASIIESTANVSIPNNDNNQPSTSQKSQDNLKNVSMIQPSNLEYLNNREEEKSLHNTHQSFLS